MRYPAIRRSFPMVMLIALFAQAVSIQALAREATAPSRPLLPTPEGGVVWARPLSGGPIRLLAIAPRAALGDFAALGERLDLRLETVGLWDAFHLGCDPASDAAFSQEGCDAQDVIKRLRALLKRRWDVIVLANFDTSILPQDLYADILDDVARGTGLLLAHVRDNGDSPLHLILQSLPKEPSEGQIGRGVADCMLPGAVRPEDTVSLLRHENGKIAWLRFPGDFPENQGLIQSPADPLAMDPVFRENLYSLAARAICAVAGRFGRTRIVDIRDAAPRGPDDTEIPPDFPPAYIQAMRDSVTFHPSRPFDIMLDPPADQPYRVRAQIRRVDSAFTVVYEEDTVLGRGATSRRFELPMGPGAYVLDVWLLDRKGVADWYSKDIIVSGWPDLDRVDIEKTYALPHDTLEIGVEMRPILSHARQATVYARAVDMYGRRISETLAGITHEGGYRLLRLHFSDLLSPVIRVEIFAVEGEPRVFSEWELYRSFRTVRYLSVRLKPLPRNFEIMAAMEEPREYAHLGFLHALSRAGVDTIHLPAGEPAIVHAARQHLRLAPELDRFSPDRIEGGQYRIPCLNDGAYRGKVEERLRDGTLRHWAGAHGRYSLGNGNRLSDTEESVCLDSGCLFQFQEWLREAYSSLESMNASWGTSFVAWEEAIPSSFGPDAAASSPASWLDFRAFARGQFSDFLGWARAHVLKADPVGKAGCRVLDDANSAHGYDWATLARTLDFLIVDYDPVVLEKIRSYGRPDSFSGAAISGLALTTGNITPEWLVWSLVLRQLPVLMLDSVHSTSNQAHPNTWLSPDGGASPALTAVCEAANAVRGTVGPLILQSQKATPVVAVYDSPRNRDFLETTPILGASMQDAQAAVIDALRYGGHDFTFIDRTGLSALTPSQQNVLVLPCCMLMDEQEIQAVLAFAAAGGTLIADLLPGTHEPSGRQRERSPLESVFGVTQSVSGSLFHGVLRSENDADLGHAAGYAETLPAGAVPGASLGNAPAWLRHQNGGFALLLNHRMRRMGRDGKARIVPGEFVLLDNFLRELGKKGQLGPEFDGEHFNYSIGVASIHALLAHPQAAIQRVRLPFSASDIVYDALSGTRIRRPHRTRARIAPGGAGVYVRLPYAVERMMVVAPEIVLPGQRLVVRIALETGSDVAGDHPVQVEWIAPDGRAVPWYSSVVTLRQGRGEAYFPLALNEAAGRYVVRVRDMLTGTVADVPVTVVVPGA